MAHAEAIHFRVVVPDTPVAPFAGVLRTGCAGDATEVVNLHAAENALEPPLLTAHTRQEYSVLGAKPLSAVELVVMLLLSMHDSSKSSSVAT